MRDEIAIKIEGVCKDFLLPHERTQSIKTAFVSTLKGKRNKTKEQQHALQDISFQINKGEFFGIVGRNGSGKSTLLKILAQIYQPTKGRVAVNGRLVPFIELGVGFNPELTGRDNVYLSSSLLGFSKTEIDSMYNRIVEFAELEKFMDQKLKNYSSGMQVRLAFSVAIQADADILLIDEVLAVGDAAFQRKCFSYFKELKAQNKTVVFVTHDMNAVREYCDRAMMIEASRKTIIGEPAEVAKAYSTLFIDESRQTTDKLKSNRWGSGGAITQDTSINIKKDSIHITATVSVSKDIGKLIYGVHVIAEDGTEVTAMNNRMILAPDIIAPRAGDCIEISWQIMNIFNDGLYTIDLTLVDDEKNTLDWLSGAGSLRVKRPERSTTAVLPPVSVITKTL